MFENTVKLISAVAWPVTTLAVAWLLRNEIRVAFGRLDSARLPGGAELSFGKSPVDQRLGRTRVTGQHIHLKESDLAKTGNLYWLGHDIMWTIDALLRGAPRETIVHGLKQSLHHLGELGLGTGKYGEWLKRIHVRASESLDSDWNGHLREQVALELRKLADQVGAIAETQQPGYTSKSMYETHRD